MASTPYPQCGKGYSKQASRSESSIPPNILIFGETGVGKSSIINMLAGKDIAKTSGDTMGQTFENVRYSISIPTEASVDDPNNTNFKEIVVWDTAGLNEAEHGKVSHERAMENIHDLVGELGNGVSLLVYVIRGWRLNIVLKTNYDIFVTGLCQGQVPVVLVVTGCENDLPIENWWIRNEKVLKTHDLHFEGHACITSTRGKIKDGEYVFEEEYRESEEKVRRLVVDNLREKPWIAGEKLLQETNAWLNEHTFNRTEPRAQRPKAGSRDRTHSMEQGPKTKMAGPHDRTYSIGQGSDRTKDQVHYTKRQYKEREDSDRYKKSRWQMNLSLKWWSFNDSENYESDAER